MSDSDRLLSVRILEQVLLEKGSLTGLIDRHTEARDAESRAFIQALCFGVCRHYQRLDFISRRLLDKPLKKKDSDLRALLLTGLYQLFFMRVPAHAAIHESVETAVQLRKAWAKQFLNAVLREAQRQQADLEAEIDKDFSLRFSHPQWILDRFKQDWPGDYQAVLAANNRQAPMSLRVNLARGERRAYLEELAAAGIGARASSLAASAVVLEQPLAVQALPGFSEGRVSVQDEASQLAAELIDLRAGQHVLDACAAPGGKSCAMLEREPGIRLSALDNDAARLTKVTQNLQRLDLHAETLCADIATPDQWWDKQLFDRILLDLPCSGTGVIRRHPDIKLLRRADSMPALLEKQARILNAVWPLLQTGGKLLYATCSVFRDENHRQLEAFVAGRSDARVPDLPGDWGQACHIGRQLLPGGADNDGFYYALLEKC